MNTDAIKDLLYRLADDDLIIGHRNSEWTGIGPILEEDIAFSSMAQDQIGHSQAYYHMLNQLFGEKTPDEMGFGREEGAFYSAHLVEYPNEDYAFSLVRHALYDYAKAVRLEALTRAGYRPLAELAKKIYREHKYHHMHGATWVKQLGDATEESNRRMQDALNKAYPLAFGLFEANEYDEALEKDLIMPREAVLQAQWEDQINDLIKASGLIVPTVEDKTAHFGGRKGRHTDYLKPLLAEMTEVYAIDPTAVW